MVMTLLKNPLVRIADVFEAHLNTNFDIVFIHLKKKTPKVHTPYVFLNDLTEFYEQLQITTNYQKFCLSFFLSFKI